VSAASLERFELLADLHGDEARLLWELLEPVELREGQQLFREGQESEGLVLVDEGSLRCESRRTGALGCHGAGTVIGAASLVVVGPRELTAVADGPSRVLLLSREAFHRFEADAPRGAARVLAAIAHLLGSTLRDSLDHLTGPPGR